MQKGPKNINLQKEGLDTEEIYTSKAYNRQKLRKQNPDTLNQHCINRAQTQKEPKPLQARPRTDRI